MYVCVVRVCVYEVTPVGAEFLCVLFLISSEEIAKGRAIARRAGGARRQRARRRTKRRAAIGRRWLLLGVYIVTYFP